MTRVSYFQNVWHGPRPPVVPFGGDTGGSPSPSHPMLLALTAAEVARRKPGEQLQCRGQGRRPDPHRSWPDPHVWRFDLHYLGVSWPFPVMGGDDFFVGFGNMAAALTPGILLTS